MYSSSTIIMVGTHPVDRWAETLRKEKKRRILSRAVPHKVRENQASLVDVHTAGRTGTRQQNISN